MNRNFLCLLAACAVGVAASARAAEPANMDSNGDGMLSASEHEAGAKAMFQAMDTDKNGSVTAAEMDAFHASMGKPPMAGEMSTAEKIKVVDGNGDGMISASEHEAASKAMFKKLDADGNGSVSKEENQAGHQAMMTK